MLILRKVRRAELEPLAGEERVLRYSRAFDDCPFAMLESHRRDILFSYGARALFHLSADRRVLRCAPTDGDDRSWQRVLLDTVLWTTSLLRGFELLHASAVETSAGVVAFAAISGAGKTSLAAEHVRRGARLFCDDILALDDPDGQVVGYPGPPLMNLPHSLPADSLGEADVIAHFDDEQWVHLKTPSPAVQPLAAVVLVDRRSGEQARCAAIEATSLSVLPHAVGYPPVGERARRRFELLGTLASTTPVLRLVADPSVPTAELADLVEKRIGVQ
jgi:hypothetical protein